MTVQEAIECLTNTHISLARNNGKTRYSDAINEAINALKNQIPKKPMLQECGFFDFRLVCPECKQPIVNVWSKAEYKPNFCHYCGKNLDWSDDNEPR